MDSKLEELLKIMDVEESQIEVQGSHLIITFEDCDSFMYAFTAISHKMKPSPEVAVYDVNHIESRFTDGNFEINCSADLERDKYIITVEGR